MVYAHGYTLLIYFDGKFINENRVMEYVGRDIALYDVEKIHMLGLVERVIRNDPSVDSTKKLQYKVLECSLSAELRLSSKHDTLTIWPIT